jgi:hypothetical protein
LEEGPPLREGCSCPGWWLQEDHRDVSRGEREKEQLHLSSPVRAGREVAEEQMENGRRTLAVGLALLSTVQHQENHQKVVLRRRLDETVNSLLTRHVPWVGELIRPDAVVLFHLVVLMRSLERSDEDEGRTKSGRGREGRREGVDLGRDRRRATDDTHGNFYMAYKDEALNTRGTRSSLPFSFARDGLDEEKHKLQLLSSASTDAPIPPRHSRVLPTPSRVPWHPLPPREESAAILFSRRRVLPTLLPLASIDTIELLIEGLDGLDEACEGAVFRGGREDFDGGRFGFFGVAGDGRRGEG